MRACMQHRGMAARASQWIVAAALLAASAVPGGAQTGSDRTARELSTSQSSSEERGRDRATRAVVMASSWGRALNPEGIVPAEGFRAVYFDRQAPRIAVLAQDVARMAINYPWSEVGNIPSERFGGYWVGRLRIARPGIREISVASSGRARIFIDGAMVFDGSDTVLAHPFTAGVHFVEVEYANNWHTTSFRVGFEDPATITRVTADRLRDVVRQRAPTAALSYVGIYESSAPDNGVAVTVPPSRRPQMIWLSSYRPVDWTIEAGRTPVALVVVTGYDVGSQVRGVPADRVVRLERGSAPPAPTKPGSAAPPPIPLEAPRLHRIDRACSCGGGRWYCQESSDLALAAEQLRMLSGLSLTGQALRYGADALTIAPWDAAAQAAVENQRRADAAAQSQCTVTAQPDFDTLMQPQR